MFANQPAKDDRASAPLKSHSNEGILQAEPDAVDFHADTIRKETPPYYVIGGGPMGYITALSLQKKGKPVVLCTRSTHFTRRGNLHNRVFGKVRELAEIKESDDHSIAQLEIRLHARAIAEKLPVVQGKFVGFGSEPLQTGRASYPVIQIKSGDETLSYPALHVFECTGTHGKVCAAVNTYYEMHSSKPYFEDKVLGENLPHKTWAFVILNASALTEKLIEKFSTLRFHEINPVSYTLGIAELRKLGWTEYDVPCIYGYKVTDESQKEMTHKINIYFQTPDNINPVDVKLFFQILVNMANGYQDTLSDTSVFDTESVSVFFVQPRYRKPAMHAKTTTIPNIYLVGETLATVPFPEARSLWAGIENLQQTLRFDFDNLDITQYIDDMQTAVQDSAIPFMLKYIGNMLARLRFYKEHTAEYYQKALSTKELTPHSKEIIEQGFEQLKKLSSLRRLSVFAPLIPDSPTSTQRKVIEEPTPVCCIMQ